MSLTTHRSADVAEARRSTGELIRHWRAHRRLSQLELSAEVGVSTRHLSFIETGRSVPSPGMVLRLAEYLEVPLRERNRMLLAAGHAPAYPESRLDAPELDSVKTAVRQILGGHEPYPALVVDRLWNVLDATSSIALLIDGVAEDLLTPPMNAYRISLHPDGIAPRIVNAAQWRGHLLHRLHRQTVLSADPGVRALYEEMSGYPGTDAQAAPYPAGPGEVAIPLRIRHGAEILSFVSTIATFGTAIDITVAEISIESFYPADARTREILHDLYAT
jgi:transcriptional regulator with XRE-family HTH domain